VNELQVPTSYGASEEQYRPPLDDITLLTGERFGPPEMYHHSEGYCRSARGAGRALVGVRLQPCRWVPRPIVGNRHSPGSPRAARLVAAGGASRAWTDASQAKPRGKRATPHGSPCGAVFLD